MSQHLTRRRFLGRIGAGLSATAFARPLLSGAPRRVSPNERIHLGLIGCGDLMRGHHMRILKTIPDFVVVACADVDQEHLDDAVKKTDGHATGYRDYRRLLDRKDVDAVLIATPDHWHALNAIHACEAGKDVYCEKPLSLTIAEGRAMVRAARRWGTVFQTGTQQRSDARFRHAVELVRNGRIGRLTSIGVVLGPGPTQGFVPDTQPPERLDWDAWLGPAPHHAYNEKRCHYTFRWFRDYSGGKLTDWGAHHLDIAQWGHGSELSGPVAVEGSGVFPADSMYDAAAEFDVRWRYADGVTLRAVGTGRNGVTFTGTDGSVFVSREAIETTPKGLLAEFPAGTGPWLPRVSAHHHHDWLECLRSRRRPISDVEIGHRSATVCHLGNIAIDLGRRLTWNPEHEQFVDDEAANRLIGKPMRAPWSL